MKILQIDRIMNVGEFITIAFFDILWLAAARCYRSPRAPQG
jgi:hypothetical protein